MGTGHTHFCRKFRILVIHVSYSRFRNEAFYLHALHYIHVCVSCHLESKAQIMLSVKIPVWIEFPQIVCKVSQTPVLDANSLCWSATTKINDKIKCPCTGFKSTHNEQICTATCRDTISWMGHFAIKSTPCKVDNDDLHYPFKMLHFPEIIH